VSRRTPGCCGLGHLPLVFTVSGSAFIGARIFFSHLPDEFGGAKVALVFVIIEAIGLYLIWSAASAGGVYVGTALTAFGYSLAFPGFGVEAVRRAPPQARGLAMGAYVAFLDMSLGIDLARAGYRLFDSCRGDTPWPSAVDGQPRDQAQRRAGRLSGHRGGPRRRTTRATPEAMQAGWQPRPRQHRECQAALAVVAYSAAAK